jgi:hypothetical protein
VALVSFGGGESLQSFLAAKNRAVSRNLSNAFPVGHNNMLFVTVAAIEPPPSRHHVRSNQIQVLLRQIVESRRRCGGKES